MATTDGRREDPRESAKPHLLMRLISSAVFIYVLAIMGSAVGFTLYTVFQPTFPATLPLRLVMAGLAVAVSTVVVASLVSARLAARHALPRPTRREMFTGTRSSAPEARILWWSRLAWAGWGVTMGLVALVAFLLESGLL
jgi:hypothetical protein